MCRTVVNITGDATAASPDMCRTVVNITGDAAVATIVAEQEK
jgi:Na+/H+-dicarboxylate symporter